MRDRQNKKFEAPEVGEESDLRLCFERYGVNKKPAFLYPQAWEKKRAPTETETEKAMERLGDAIAGALPHGVGNWRNLKKETYPYINLGPHQAVASAKKGGIVVGIIREKDFRGGIFVGVAGPRIGGPIQGSPEAVACELSLPTIASMVWKEASKATGIGFVSADWLKQEIPF